ENVDAGSTIRRYGLACTQLKRALRDLEFLLHLFERDALSFRIEKKHDEELHHHHRGEKRERVAAGRRSHKRKRPGNQRVHDPVRKTAEALALGAHAVWKNFAEIDPDHRALGKRKEGKDAVQIVQDGVDPGELIEHSDGDGQENGDAVFCGEERVALDVLRVDGLYDFSQLLVRIFFTGQAKHVPGFVRSSLLDQPAR